MLTALDKKGIKKTAVNKNLQRLQTATNKIK
jgi:hypothetical protein